MTKLHKDYFKTGQLSLEQQVGYYLGTAYDLLGEYRLTRNNKYLDKLIEQTSLAKKVSNSSYNTTTYHYYYSEAELYNLAEHYTFKEIMDNFIKLNYLKGYQLHYKINHSSNLDSAVDILNNIQLVELSNDNHSRLDSLKFLMYEEVIDEDTGKELITKFYKCLSHDIKFYKDEYDSYLDD